MLLCGTAGTVVWKRLPAALHFLVVLFFIAFATNIIALWLHPNTWLFNLYIPVDFGCVLLAATAFLPSRARRYLPICGGLYLASWLLCICTSGIHAFANWAFLTGCLLLTLIYLIVLFQSSLSDAIPGRRNIYLLCFGILLYYAGSIPLFGMLNYLIRVYPKTAKLLYGNINWGLSLARYLLILLYFLSHARKQPATDAGKTGAIL